MVLARLLLVALLSTVGCAPAVPSARERDAAWVTARAPEGCGSGDEACCRGLEETVRTARARFDDRTADDAIERIALFCPAQARAILDRQSEKVRTLDRNQRGEIRIKYLLDLAPEDRLFWAAAYVDGQERAGAAPPGQHRIEVELQMIPGGGPKQGGLLRLKRVQPLPIDVAATASVSIKVSRIPGAEPYALEVTVEPVGALVGGVGSVADVLTEADLQALPRYERPRRLASPSFYAPSELLLATAPRTRMQNCVGPGGRLLSSGVGVRGRQPHPRLLGAALDWLRRFEYEPTKWDRRVRMVCEEIEVRFDQSPLPAPVPGGVLSAQFEP